jgi:hypothetical protein
MAGTPHHYDKRVHSGERENNIITLLVIDIAGRFLISIFRLFKYQEAPIWLLINSLTPSFLKRVLHSQRLAHKIKLFYYRITVNSRFDPNSHFATTGRLRESHRKNHTIIVLAINTALISTAI